MTIDRQHAKWIYNGNALSGPQGHPIVGNLLDIKRDPLGYFVNLQERYGDVVPIKMGFDTVLMLNNPVHIKHVLQDNYRNYSKSKYTQKLRPLLGDGIFLAEGESWLHQRRSSLPAFKGLSLARMADKMVEATAETLDRWDRELAGGQQFDMSREMMRLTLDIVFRTLFTVRLDDRSDAIFHNLTLVLREFERRVWAPTRIGEYLPTKTTRKFRRALRELDELVYAIIAARRKDAGNYGDLLDLLFEAHGGADPSAETARLLRNQIISFVIAGHETTAVSMSWCWLVLSQNPAIEKRVVDEIEQALQGRAPNFKDLPALSYSSLVFEEAMRLYPPVWSMSRTAVEDDFAAGLHIPAGTTVMLCPYVVHRNANLWPNPEGFDPERHTKAASEQRHPLAYFPFGGGPHVCLGRRFAQMEAPLVMSMILQKYHVDLIPGRVIEPEPIITLRPKNGLWMALRERSLPIRHVGPQTNRVTTPAVAACPMAAA